MTKDERLALKKVEYEGKVFKTKNYGDILVLRYVSSKGVLIKFMNTGNTKYAHISAIRKMEVRDTEAFPVYKVGIMDIPNELKKDAPTPKEYSLWNGMKSRCYNENIRHLLPTYSEVTMSENFKKYSYFKDWCSKQVGFDQEGFHLDKDLLSLDSKIYSENTCCFIPSEINCAVTNNKSVRGKFPQGVIYNCTKTRYRARIQRGDKWESLGTYDTPEEAFYAYKPVKEAHIKSLAEKWKDRIDPRVYNVLINWEVNIDD